MFKTILHFTKSQIIQTATSKMANEAMKSPLIFRSLFFLSQQKTEQSQENITSHEETIQIENASAKFYKNSIRKVNINDKGRGKFTQHHLLNLIKLVKTAEEEPLLFEAYYNYLGHFTLFDSRVVDKMLQKSMSFQTCSISNILDIYKNHNYLAYFPHYNITRTLINLLQSQPQHYQKLINILLVSPLIKFDHQIIQNILEQINNIKTPYNIFSSLTKLIISRSSLNLLDQIKQKRQLLTLLTVALKGRLDNQIFKSTKSGAYFEQWCNKLLESNQNSDQLHYELTIVGSFFQATNIFADNLLLIKDQKLIIDALLYLECSHPISQQKVVDYLQKLQISQSLRVRLNQFRQSKEGDPSATQTQ